MASQDKKQRRTQRKKKAQARQKARQLTMSFVRVAGPGKKLGRKPSPNSGVSHAKRPELPPNTPVHITMKFVEGLPNLRDDGVWRVLVRSLRESNEKSRVRVVHFSVQSNHMHMICEAEDKSALSNGMQSLKVRMARALERYWQRPGNVFADRYHRTDLTSPAQIRNCIRYVLQNIFRHRSECDVPNRHRPDPYSSGRWFTGWREAELRPDEAALDAAPVARPSTWLLSKGWTKGGLLSIDERPASAA